MKLNSHNEWDKLKEVILGNIDTKPCIPFVKKTNFTKTDLEIIEKISNEIYPKWLIDEAKEDLDGLYNVLKDFGVKIYRPENSIVGKNFSSIYWHASSEGVYNARDLNLIVGDTIIDSPSQEKYRYFESLGYYKIFYEYFTRGCKWVAGPKPKLDEKYLMNYFENGERFQKLSENEIMFEAANVIRMGKDLLYLVSRSGNKLGAKWLQSVLGDKYRVHITEKIYRSSHIDSTVMCLKPGLVLLNAARVNEQNCPKLFKKWNKLYFSDIVKTPEQTVAFHNNIRKKNYEKLKQLNIESDFDHLASDWIGMNFLSLDPKTIVIDKRQVKLIKLLEENKFQIIPISFRHSYLFKGGLHCCTLDTVRESKLESYFE